MAEEVSTEAPEGDVTDSDEPQEDPTAKMRDDERLNLAQLSDARLQKELRELNEESQRLQAAIPENGPARSRDGIAASGRELQAKSSVAEAKHQDELRELRGQQEKQALILAQQEMDLQKASFELRQKAMQNEALNADFAQAEFARQQAWPKEF